MLAKDQSQPVKQLRSAKPDVFVFSQLDTWLKRFVEATPHQAVCAVGSHEQLGRFELGEIIYGCIEPDIDAEIQASLLQDVKKREPGDTGEIISANGDLFALMNYIDVVPSLTGSRDLCETRFVVLF